MIDPVRLQAPQERELYNGLMADPAVDKARRRMDELLYGHGFPLRRKLLGDALRLTRAMAPQVAEALAACRDAIGYHQPIEVYLRRDPSGTASVMHDSLAPSAIVLSSWLLEAFTPGELRAIIGHELGHLALEHFRLRPSLLAGMDEVGLETMLKLFNWSRWAELSADRVGMICARDVEQALAAEFKLASGVSSAVVRPDLEAFAQQVDALVSAPSTSPFSSDDVLSTHPFSSIRARALLLFARSRTCREALGQPPSSEGALADEEVARLVGQDLRQMEAGFLQSREPSAARAKRLLYCAGLSVAGMCVDIDEHERRALAALLGADAMEEFARRERSRHGVWPRARKTLGTAGALAAVRAELEGLLDEARRGMSPKDRLQVVQLLCIVARADRHVAPEELEEMERIAARLEVDPLVVVQTIRASAAPLD